MYVGGECFYACVLVFAGDYLRLLDKNYFGEGRDSDIMLK